MSEAKRLLFFIDCHHPDPFANPDPEPVGVWATDGKELGFDYLYTLEWQERYWEWANALFPDEGPLKLPSALELNEEGMTHLAGSMGYHYNATRPMWIAWEGKIDDFTTWAVENIEELLERVYKANQEGRSVV